MGKEPGWLDRAPPRTRKGLPEHPAAPDRRSVLAAATGAARTGEIGRLRHAAELEGLADVVVDGVAQPLHLFLRGEERLGDRVGNVYTAFGHVLRERFQSWRVVFLSTDRSLAERVDKRVERMTQFKNGGISVSAWSFLP